MEKNRGICFVRNAGAVLLIVVTMMIGAVVFVTEPVHAKTTKPGKIEEDTVMLKEVTVDTLKITFGASKRAAGYQIRYKRSGAGSWKTVRTGKQTVTLKKLKKNTKYKVQVRGINNRENGAWTKTKTFRTLGKEYDVAPSTVKRKSATQDTMTVRFGRAPKATKYQLRYKKADDEKWKTITTQKRTITLDKLEKYTKYKVQVRGIKGSKKGTWTKEKTITTLGDRRVLTFDAGKYGELDGVEKKMYLYAGEEIGDMPIPLVSDTKGKKKLTFYNWSKKKGKEEPVIKETTLMPDRNMTVYAYYAEGGAGEMFSFSDEGKLLKFGGENWIILDKMFTNGKPMPGMVLLLADDTKYTDSFSNFSDNKWEKSRAQKWCTNFYRKTGGFSDLEKNAIIGVKTTEDTEDYEYRVGSRKIKLKGCNFDGTSGDKNKVFFLSAREYKIYNKSVTGEKNIPTSREWLLRTPGAEKNGLVATVHGSGRVNLTSTKNKRALRPAINIDPGKFPGVIGSGTEEDPYAFCDQATVDRMAADEVKEIIRELPDKNKEDRLTDGEKEEIERAVGAYNSLTKDQKRLIDADTLKKLKTLKELAIGVLYEDETVYRSIYLENKPNIVLEDVTIYGDLTIKDARAVKMKNVTVVNGDVKIISRYEDRKTFVTMDNVTSPQGCYLRYVDSDAIDELKISSGQFHLYGSTVRKFRRSSVNGGSSDKAMLMEHTFITLMENCEVRSDKTAIHILTSPGFLRTDDSIETMRHCYIWADSNTVYLSPHAFIGTIDDSVLIAKNGRCIYGYANPRPVKTLVGEAIIYSGNGYAVQTSQHGDKDYLVVDRFTQDAVGQVRLYGSWGLDVKGEAAEVHFAAPKGYHLENTDARYNTVSNDRLRKAGDADFTGKAFYYVIKDDKKDGDAEMTGEPETFGEPEMSDELKMTDEPALSDEAVRPDKPEGTDHGGPDLTIESNNGL